MRRRPAKSKFSLDCWAVSASNRSRLPALRYLFEAERQTETNRITNKAMTAIPTGITSFTRSSRAHPRATRVLGARLSLCDVLCSQHDALRARTHPSRERQTMNLQAMQVARPSSPATAIVNPKENSTRPKARGTKYQCAAPIRSVGAREGTRVCNPMTSTTMPESATTPRTRSSWTTFATLGTVPLVNLD